MRETPKSIVVGFDTSEESKNAVTWAAIVAQRRNAPLTVVTATGAPQPSRERSTRAKVEDPSQQSAQEGAQIASEVAPGVEVNATMVDDSPTAAFERMSSDAQLIVLGHRGAGALRFGQLGSVALSVANHARCPVAIIRGEARTLPNEGFPSVVAVDGSHHSEIALDQAAQWAMETNSKLRIVSAWSIPSTVSWAGLAPGAVDTTSTEQRLQGAEQSAREVVTEAEQRVKNAHPNLVTEGLVGRGQPADVIVKAAEEASLIVIGARGRGGIASLLLGSVSREVVEHARAPVYIVR